MTAQPPPPPAPSPDRPTPHPPGWRRWAGNAWLRTGFGLAVLALILGGLFAYDNLDSSDDDCADDTAGSFVISTDEPDVGALDSRQPRAGEPAPQFALRDPEGQVHRLSDYAGSPIWLNFWATWCIPCERELPDIQRLAREFEDDLVVLEINYQETACQALDFWEERNLTLPILLDRTGEVAEQYRFRGFPDSVFIDREGTVRSVQFGFLEEGEMRERLAEIGVE